MTFSDKICKTYAHGLSIATVARQYNISVGGVYNILIRENQKIRSKSEASRRYLLDQKAFSIIDNNEKAYWLGFLAGDGCVSVKNEVRLEISKKDRQHLEKYKSFLKTDAPIKDSVRICSLSKKQSISEMNRVSVHSAIMQKDLASHGIIKNKSFVLKFSQNIPAEFLNSYILGLIDSDGCIYKNKSNNQINIQLTSTLDVVKNCKKILATECKAGGSVSKHRSEPTYILSFGGNSQVKRILQYLYNNNIVYLPRKHIIGKELL